MFWLGSLVLVCLISACGGTKTAVPAIETPALKSGLPPMSLPVSKVAPARQVKIVLQATDTVNPDPNNRASPLALRLFQLKSELQFANSGLYSLLDNSDPSLSSELISVKNLILRPGQRVEMSITLDAQASHLGIVGSYRNIDAAQWRAVYAFDAKPKQTVQVTADRLAVSIATSDQQ